MLSPEQIEEITELAACFFLEEEILEIMQLKVPSPEFKNACKTGYLLSEAKLRKSILDLAQAGSAPAQAMAVKLLSELKRSK